MIDNFRLYFPSLVERAVKVCKIDGWTLKVTLDDGDVILYDDLSKTIRLLPSIDEYDSKDGFCKEFGKRLVMIMNHKNISQNQLSVLTGISQSHISDYIRGRRCPTFYTIDKIARALECTTDEFRYLDVN